MDLMPLSRADAQGELAWRWGFIWATVNLVLAGLLLSTGNTRRHSSWNIVAALLVFRLLYLIAPLCLGVVAVAVFERSRIVKAPPAD